MRATYALAPRLIGLARPNYRGVLKRWPNVMPSGHGKEETVWVCGHFHATREQALGCAQRQLSR